MVSMVGVWFYCTKLISWKVAANLKMTAKKKSPLVKHFIFHHNLSIGSCHCQSQLDLSFEKLMCKKNAFSSFFWIITKKCSFQMDPAPAHQLWNRNPDFSVYCSHRLQLLEVSDFDKPFSFYKQKRGSTFGLKR